MLALALALPTAAFAQGAGDEQYQDPFADEQTQNEGGGGGSGSGGGNRDGGANGRAAQDDGGLSDEPPGTPGDDGDTEPTPPPEDPAEEPEEEPAPEARNLPNTGSEPLLLGYAGLLFVLIGVGLRLRTIDPDAY